VGRGKVAAVGTAAAIWADSPAARVAARVAMAATAVKAAVKAAGVQTGAGAKTADSASSRVAATARAVAVALAVTGAVAVSAEAMAGVVEATAAMAADIPGARRRSRCNPCLGCSMRTATQGRRRRRCGC